MPRDAWMPKKLWMAKEPMMTKELKMTEKHGKREQQGNREQQGKRAQHGTKQHGMQEVDRVADERCSIPGSLEWVMGSRCQRRDYRIMVALPQEPPSEGGYPIIYALDGDAVFATFAQAVQIQTRKPHGYEPAIVVGIGYFSGEPFDMERRCFDFTMPADSGNLPERPGGRDWPENGGADGFLDFLELELMPEIERRFPANPEKRALFGHSLGGLFVLHALFTRPQLYRLYAAGSPSIWWNRHAVLEEIPAFEAWVSGTGRQEQQESQEQQERPYKLPRLLLTIGSEELDHMVADTEKLAERLNSLEPRGFRIDLIKFPEEGHVSVLPSAISRVIKAALNRP